MIKCQYCGRENQDDNRFCGGCGAELLLSDFVDPFSESETIKYINNPFEEMERKTFAPKPIQPKAQPQKARSSKQTGQNDTLCVAGFVVAVSSLFLCGLPAIIGLILSIIGVARVQKTGRKGENYAIWGIIISIAVMFIFCFAYASANRTARNLSSPFTTSTTSTHWYSNSK
ncbi:MAG: zinc ribbon domain-containing protein [Clostridiales bacterium]|nr:zinc ribbon domain-containing protein [Clostridiales bacterium]